jgi:hypothetical protein
VSIVIFYHCHLLCTRKHCNPCGVVFDTHPLRKDLFVIEKWKSATKFLFQNLSIGGVPALFVAEIGHGRGCRHFPDGKVGMLLYRLCYMKCQPLLFWNAVNAISLPLNPYKADYFIFLSLMQSARVVYMLEENSPLQACVNALCGTSLFSMRGLVVADFHSLSINDSCVLPQMMGYFEF